MLDKLHDVTRVKLFVRIDVISFRYPLDLFQSIPHRYIRTLVKRLCSGHTPQCFRVEGEVLGCFLMLLRSCLACRWNAGIGAPCRLVYLYFCGYGLLIACTFYIMARSGCRSAKRLPRDPETDHAHLIFEGCAIHYQLQNDTSTRATFMPHYLHWNTHA